MANLEAIVSKKTENDTQWKARQQADRETLRPIDYETRLLRNQLW